MVFLGGDLIVELVGHAEEDDGEGEPLVAVDGVLEDDDAHQDGQYLARGRHQRVDVLLEIRYHVVDRHLSRHLQAADPHQLPHRTWMPHAEKEGRLELASHKRKDEDEDEAVEIRCQEELVGSGFEIGLTVCLAVAEEGIAYNGNEQQRIADPLLVGVEVEVLRLFALHRATATVS